MLSPSPARRGPSRACLGPPLSGRTLRVSRSVASDRSMHRVPPRTPSVGSEATRYAASRPPSLRLLQPGAAWHPLAWLWWLWCSWPAACGPGHVSYSVCYTQEIMPCMAVGRLPEVGMYMTSKRAVWASSIECCMPDVLCMMERREESLGLARAKSARPAGPLCYTRGNIA